jgi:hypothetical protein
MQNACNKHGSDEICMEYFNEETNYVECKRPFMRSKHRKSIELKIIRDRGLILSVSITESQNFRFS